jgi:hypothetical protein
MPKLTLELAIFLIVLLVIAAAFDLWLLRAWKRRRAYHRRIGPDSAAPPAKAGRRPAAKKPAAAASAPRGKAKAPVQPQATEGQRTVEIQPAGKRSRKAAARSASLSVRGKTGRTAHVDISMDLPEGESIRLTLESVGSGVTFTAGEKGEAGGLAAAAAARAPAWLGATIPAARGFLSSVLEDARASGRQLFTLALILYLLTRLIGLTNWPIYFFTDEAVQTNFAAELVDNDFVWDEGEVLPTFFENAGQYEMNFSVYVQVVPYLLFGKSVFVTRAVSALITLLAAAGVAWILRRIFRLPLWWSGVLLLSIIPVWFLHSRTAFEPGESIAFYALFLYFYMRYREDSPWMLLPALFFGALSAYTYSPSQVAVAATGALLLLSDIRYHWRHKAVALAGLGMLILCSIPYLRFLYLHPDANERQLAIVSSYWLNDIPFADKLRLFAQQYLSGLDPRYWYLADPPEGVQHDIMRHLMKGYGHLSLWSLPFAAAGIVLCLFNIGRSRFRTVLIALLAAPTGGAIAQITITRTLIMVIPASLLTALGISWLLALFERAEDPPQPEFLLQWKERLSRWLAALPALRETLAALPARSGAGAFLSGWRERIVRIAAASPGPARIPRAFLALALFAVLGSANVYMLWDSLANGPTWYDNYELYGMQYGGQQLAAALVEYQNLHPDAQLIVTSAWANGTDEIYRFFLPEENLREIRTGSVLQYIQEFIPISPRDVFVMTAGEYSIAVSSGRFAEVNVEQTLPYPDGRDGFYFARLAYVADIQEIIAAEKAELAKPVTEDITLYADPGSAGETIRVVHSRFDMGYLSAAFDGKPYSLMRTESANPMALDLYFPQPHRLTQITVRVGGAPTLVKAFLYPSGGGDPQVFSAEVERASDYRNVTILLPTPVETDHLRLEIETVGEGEPTHVHVYEIRLEGVGWKSGTAGPLP